MNACTTTEQQARAISEILHPLSLIERSVLRCRPGTDLGRAVERLLSAHEVRKTS